MNFWALGSGDSGLLFPRSRGLFYVGYEWEELVRMEKTMGATIYLELSYSLSS